MPFLQTLRAIAAWRAAKVHHLCGNRACRRLHHVASFVQRTRISSFPCASDRCGVARLWTQRLLLAIALSSRERSLKTAFYRLITNKGFNCELRVLCAFGRHRDDIPQIRCVVGNEDCG